MNTFLRVAGFCPDCGSVLPPLTDKGGINCYACPRKFAADAIDTFEDTRVRYKVHFNAREGREKDFKEEINEDEGEEGPVVERRCPKCGNERMSYATLQLRSADEGQTVFYTCTKCKFKETENS